MIVSGPSCSFCFVQEPFYSVSFINQKWNKKMANVSGLIGYTQNKAINREFMNNASGDNRIARVLFG